jgi:multidrug efflux pump subunit AcrA (membrane-fusion protein)
MSAKKKGRARKTILIIAALAVAAAGLAFAVTRGNKNAKEKAEETTVVEKRSVDDIIEVSGHLEPRLEQEIRAPSEGIVEEVFARSGERLSAGEAIARIDSTQAVFSADQTRYQIEQESFAGNRRKVELLRRELEAKERAVDDLTLRAHIDGTLSRLDLKEGDVLKAGESYGRVIDVRSLVANVEIPEADIPRAKSGLKVDFRFPAIPGLVAQGRVDSFPSEARINAKGLTVLDAKLVIDAPPKGLLPAYSFTALIKAGDPREVLVADSRAFSYKAGKPFVDRRKVGGSWESVSVETEGFGSGLVRIVAGCAAGEVLRIPAPKDKR